MALPSNVSFGTVTGTFLLASADSPSDQDRDPEGNPATDLTFTFTADLTPAVARDPSASPPTMFALLPVAATVGQDGSLLGPDGAPGVRLVASTNPNLQPTGWTWNVALKSSTFPKLSFSFQLDPNATVDLSTVLQVPANPGSTLNAWLQAVADAQAARDAAIAAAANAQAGGLAAWAPNTAYTTSSKVLNPSGDLVQATSAHTSGSSYDASKWAVVIAGDLTSKTTYIAMAVTPPDHTIVKAYLDISVVPPALKGWNGTAWVAIGGGTVTPAVTTVDNGDGTFTATGTGVTDNGDGTYSITDSTVTANADGTFTLAA